MVLFFSVRGEGKCEIDYKKTENFFFSFKKESGNFSDYEQR